MAFRPNLHRVRRESLKGVVVARKKLAPVLEYGAALPGEVMLVSAPLYHKRVDGVKLAFASGGKVVLLPQFSAGEYLDAITKHRVTMCSGVPTMYALVTAELQKTLISMIFLRYSSFDWFRTPDGSPI